MPDLPPARSVRRAPLGGEPHGHVVLRHEERLLRRRRLVTTGGEGFLVDLPATTDVGPGDAFLLEDGRLIAVEAAPEALLEVRGPDLARLAWHIGNRHAPCRIEAGRLLVPHDHVLAGMLRQLGAELREVTAPFQPEGGAYGHGRTMGHHHRHDDHDGHDGHGDHDAGAGHPGRGGAGQGHGR